MKTMQTIYLIVSTCSSINTVVLWSQSFSSLVPDFSFDRVWSSLKNLKVLGSQKLVTKLKIRWKKQKHQLTSEAKKTEPVFSSLLFFFLSSTSDKWMIGWLLLERAFMLLEARSLFDDIISYFCQSRANFC